MNKDNIVGFFVIIGAVVGLVVAHQLPDAEAGTYIGGLIVGAIAGVIAGHVIWIAIGLIIVAIILAVNVGGFVVRHEIGSAIAETVRESAPSRPTFSPAAPQAQVEKVAAVCVDNGLGKDVSLNYRWGEQPWTQLEIEEGYVRYFWQEYETGSQTSSDFQIRLDVDFTDALDFQTFTLNRYAVKGTVDCDNAYRYELRFAQRNKVALYNMED